MVEYTKDEILAENIKLVDRILESDLYQEYLSLKEKIRKNEELVGKIEELKFLQQKYVKSSYQDKEVEEKIQKYEERLSCNPLYAAYQEKVEELDQLCFVIKEGLNEAFQELLAE